MSQCRGLGQAAAATCALPPLPCTASACVQRLSQEWGLVPEPVAPGCYEVLTQPFVCLGLFAVAFASSPGINPLHPAVLTYSVQYLC